MVLSISKPRATHNTYWFALDAVFSYSETMLTGEAEKLTRIRPRVDIQTIQQTGRP